MIQTFKFYCKLSAFSIKEEQSSVSSTLSGLILYPFFIWVFSKLWLELNNHVSTFQMVSLFAYIGLTEILFMTSLREPFIDKAGKDFYFSFVRPRIWPFYISIPIYSRTLFRRLVYLLLYVFLIPIFTERFELSLQASMRFIFFLPFITLFDTLYSFLFTCVQTRFYTSKNFRMLFGKLFLIFGGVLAPLSDVPGYWQTIFINTPFSDLIFQPCYFSIKGEFYHLTFLEWLTRINIQLICLVVIAFFVYKSSRNHYHNFGG